MPRKYKQKLLQKYIPYATSKLTVKSATTLKNKEVQSITNPNDSISVCEENNYDQRLLGCAATQWQFGDWDSLVQIKDEHLLHHPDKARLALLVAAGHQQLGNMELAKKYIYLASDWGCSRELILQILIAGVHNTLGNACILDDKIEKAQYHYLTSVKIGAPLADAKLIGPVRYASQSAVIDSKILTITQTSELI